MAVAPVASSLQLLIVYFIIMFVVLSVFQVVKFVIIIIIIIINPMRMRLNYKMASTSFNKIKLAAALSLFLKLAGRSLRNI